MPAAKGPSEFVSAAYRLEDESDLVEFYQRWADDYDREMVDGLGYDAPLKIAQKLRQYLPQTDATILDIGCGTGLTCTYLAANGYLNLDGIDLSPDMIRVAAERKIYRHLLEGDINQPFERDDASYDGAISSGTFTHGHVGPEPFDDIFRILKSGGYFAFTVHLDLWQTMGFDSRIEQLSHRGIVEAIEMSQDSYYRDSPPEGWFCLLQKIA